MGQSLLDDEGLGELSEMEIEAFTLSRAAVLLDTARSDRTDCSALVEALDNNLRLWVAIKTLAQSKTSALPMMLKDNLIRLADYVTGTTLAHGAGISDDLVDSLATINIRISDGLLEGRRHQQAAVVAA